MAELWDAFDINRQKTGRFHERGNSMNAGDCHLIVQVWIISSNNDFLIFKQSDPVNGKWMTTGGCAIAGEDSLTAVLRETKEELGIDLNINKGFLFKQFSEPHYNDEGIALFDIWIFKQDVQLESIIFQLEETCDAKWVNQGELRNMISNNEFMIKWYSYFTEIIEYISNKK